MSIFLYNSIVSFRSFDPFLVETMLLTWFDHLSIEYDDNFWLSFTILPKFSLTKHFPLHVRCAVIIHLVLTTCGTWPLRNHFGFTFLLSWFQLFDSWWAVSAFIMLMSLIQVWCESDTLPVRSTFRYSLCISLTITPLSAGQEAWLTGWVHMSAYDCRNHVHLDDHRRGLQSGSMRADRCPSIRRLLKCHRSLSPSASELC